MGAVGTFLGIVVGESGIVKAKGDGTSNALAKSVAPAVRFA